MEKRCGFRSFFLGGFECSTHRLANGERLDLLASTGHEQYAESDYRELSNRGIRTVRDGVRWHLIEQRPGFYDWSSARPMLAAARRAGVQVIWDLFHYGWPDDIDIFSPAFIARFEKFAAAFAKFYAAEFGSDLYVCPTNEISFLSWGGGESGCLNPFATGRGFELKRQIVRANIHAIEAIRRYLPRARIVQIDPAIHITADPRTSSEEFLRDAEHHRQHMFQAWDMLAGRCCPELGGHIRYLDIVGVNYYVQNQWLHHDCTIYRGHPLYRPPSEILNEIYRRYERPIFIAETGIEDDLRPDWLRYMSDEVVAAHEIGVPVEGLCLYPVVNHPGWNDGRHCHNGLFDYCDTAGRRQCCGDLDREVAVQSDRLRRSWDRLLRSDFDRQTADEAVCV